MPASGNILSRQHAFNSIISSFITTKTVFILFYYSDKSLLLGVKCLFKHQDLIIDVKGEKSQ